MASNFSHGDSTSADQTQETSTDTLLPSNRATNYTVLSFMATRLESRNYWLSCWTPTRLIDTVRPRKLCENKHRSMATPVQQLGMKPIWIQLKKVAVPLNFVGLLNLQGTLHFTLQWCWDTKVSDWLVLCRRYIQTSCLLRMVGSCSTSLLLTTHNVFNCISSNSNFTWCSFLSLSHTL